MLFILFPTSVLGYDYDPKINIIPIPRIFSPDTPRSLSQGVTSSDTSWLGSCSIGRGPDVRYVVWTQSSPFLFELWIENSLTSGIYNRKWKGSRESSTRSTVCQCRSLCGLSLPPLLSRHPPSYSGLSDRLDQVLNRVWLPFIGNGLILEW